MKGKSKVVLLHIVAIAVGFGLGFLVKSELPGPSTDTDIKWQAQFTEEADHKRVMDFQNALETLKANGAKDTDALSKQLDLQLRIEDLIIKSREAGYAKWTPFTPLFTGGVGAILGFLTGLLGRKPTGSAETPK